MRQTLTAAWRRPATPWLAWVAVLGVSAAAYGHQEALVHFLWHLAYGGSAGVLLGLALGRGRRAASHRALSAWALAGYAYMVVPDLLWLAGRAATGAAWEHEPWMDIFLLHVSLDRFPYATPGAPVVVSAAALATWLGRRRVRAV